MHLYGLNLGVGPIEQRSPPASPWSSVVLTRIEGAAATSTTVAVNETSALLTVAGAIELSLTRSDPLGLVVRSPAPVLDADLVHPLGAFVGAVAARWTGRTALHGAGVIVDGRTWVLLGRAGSGKSTLAAVLSGRGHLVAADDLTVIDDGSTVLAGPPIGDLRVGAAEQLGVGSLISDLGRARYRLTLLAAPLETPLGGFVLLEWADQVLVGKLRAAERLEALGAHEALAQGPSHPTAFLELLAWPFLRLSRPQTWGAMEDSVDALVEGILAQR